MLQQNYLLWIDDSPIDKKLMDYFSTHHLLVKQQRSILPIPIEPGIPFAILINSSFLEHELQIINQLYTSCPTPLIVITNKTCQERCIDALEAGADDCLINPLNYQELYAKILTIKRRINLNLRQTRLEKKIYEFDYWVLITTSRQLFKENHQEVLLSTGEYNLLHAFVQHPKQILNRVFLLQITDHNNLDPLDRRVDVQIGRLRQKIEVDAKNPSLIKTIRNKGYVFNHDVNIR